MRTMIWVAGVATVLAAAMVTATEGEVEYRQHTMRAVGGHMQAAVDIIRQKVSHAEHMKLHAGALANLSEILPALFPGGSEGGDALPAIWQQPDDFAERLAAIREAAAAFSSAAQSNDSAAIRQAFQAVGGACKGCHDNYRAE
jgi:cytochrome c556